MSNKEGITHWVDGRASWNLGLIGFFVRLRGYIVFTILFPLPLAGVPFWWPDSLPDAIQIRTVSFIFHSFPIIFCMMSLAFFYYRHQSRRSLEIKAELQKLTSDSRDAFVQLLSRNQSRKGKVGSKNLQHERKHLIDFSNSACDTIARYFSKLTRDETVGCAIRIATVRGNSLPTEYVTIGRGGKLSKSRGDTSVGISINDGIPKFFLSDKVGGKGVLFYEDLVKAAASEAYKKTKNDEIHGDEVKTIAVIPVKGWNGTREDLIGLLFLTSQTKKILQPRLVDVMMMIANNLSTVYSGMFSKLQDSRSLPSF